MKKLVLIMIIIVLIPFAMVGCTDQPSSPPQTFYPRMVLDYQEGGPNGTTTIYVSGVEMTRYSNISILQDGDLAAHTNNSFSLEYETLKGEFELEVFASTEELNFFFHAHIMVINEDNIVYEITTDENAIRNVREGDLPYIQRMSRMEVE